jgi:putative DNA primase/helicase
MSHDPTLALDEGYVDGLLASEEHGDRDREEHGDRDREEHGDRDREVLHFLDERLAEISSVVAPTLGDRPRPDAGAAMAGVDGFRYTDAGHADRLLHRHGHEVRFVPLWRRWLAYDGTRWRLDHSDTVVAHLAAEIGAQLVARVPEVYGEPSKLNPLLAAVRRAESAAGVAATLTMAASKPGIAIDHEVLDADPWLLNVANGTIDLRTGQRRQHDPTDLLMMVANVDHDPTATAPCWEQFLKQVLPDDEVRRFVARLCGLALVGTQIEHVLVICLGGGANGKSTMTKVVADVLGDYAIVAARDVLLALKHDSHPTAKADLFRRRFAHSGELPPSAKLDEAQVKELTGGDRIKARRMREDHWEFDPSHLLWLHANHRPMIEGTDDGIWRRVLLIPFNVQVPVADRDPYLARKIVDTESAGVLQWMLDGLADYLANGLQVPEVVRAATAGYRTESDTVARFLAESDLVIAPNAMVDSNDLIFVHQEWHRASGSNETENAHYQRVVAALKERGATNKRRGKDRTRCWIGVGFTP